MLIFIEEQARGGGSEEEGSASAGARAAAASPRRAGHLLPCAPALDLLRALVPVSGGA